MNRLLFFIAIASLVITSCGGGGATAIEGTSVEMRHSQLLSLKECDGYVYAQIQDPWDSAVVLHSYVLVDSGAPLPGNLPVGDVLRIPLTNAVVYASVHCSLLDELGAYDAIRGVADVPYLNDKRLAADCEAGRIADIGSSLNPSIEAIMDLQPQAILLSPYQNSGTYGKLGKMGIPLIECADYMEMGPLARAEWMRFYGLLFGKASVADSLFADVEGSYNELKALAAKEKDAPSVITDLKQGNTWFVPGGHSTMGCLIADAGGRYVFGGTTESGSLELAPEIVFDKAIDADIWLVKYHQPKTKTYDEIAREYPNNARIKAFREKRVYQCNTALCSFYEDIPFHPDLLLRDFVKIFHPGILPEHKPRYYK